MRLVSYKKKRVYLDLFDLPLPIIFGLFGFIWSNLLVTLLAKEVSESKETEGQLLRRVGIVR